MWLVGIFFGSLDVLWVFFGCSLDVLWILFGSSLDVLCILFGSSSDHFVDPRQPSDTDHFLFFASPRSNLVFAASHREEPALVCLKRALSYGNPNGRRSQEAYKYVCMVSLQQTMHDDAVDVRIHSACDTFLTQLCAELDAGTPIPYLVRLRVKVGVVFNKDESFKLEELIQNGVVVDGAELPPHPNGEVYVCCWRWRWRWSWWWC